MSKTPESYFADWESHVFGLGYGSGERFVLMALKGVFSAVGCNGRPNSYDYRNLEEAVTPTVAWLLINVLGRNNLIEYGTSTRFAWLTKEGEALKAFVDSKTVDELVDICCSREDLDYCWPEGCNCGPQGHEAGKFFCDNPFWKRSS